MAKELKLSSETASVATLYIQLFFLAESYLEHERELVCCACLFVACKLLYQRMRVSDLCVQYYNLKQPMHPPIKDEQKKDFTDRLFVAECTLLKVVDFKLDLDSAAQ